MDTKMPRSRATLTPPAARWSVGGLLIEALARQDFGEMGDCLDADVWLRALLPLGLVERRGRDDVLGLFRSWFGGSDQLELVDATVGEVGPRLYLRWRVALTPLGCPGPRRLIEQHAFAATGDRVSALDLLCSGFVCRSTWLGDDKGGGQ